jgi:hypothetical protein
MRLITVRYLCHFILSNNFWNSFVPVVFELKFRLIMYCFSSRSRIFHLYGDDTITSEGLQNLGLYSALKTFEQGGIFIMLHML